MFHHSFTTRYLAFAAPPKELVSVDALKVQERVKVLDNFHSFAFDLLICGKNIGDLSGRKRERG